MKGQSNPEISRSPRNSFRASPHELDRAGRAPDRLGGLTACRSEPNSEWRGPDVRSQSAWAKLRAREGNSPDRPPRPPSPCRVAKDVRSPRQPGCWLRSSHAFKECVTAHWSSGSAPTIHGAKHGAEAAGRGRTSPAVGERRLEGEARGATPRGRQASEDAGMSSETGARNSRAASPRFPGRG